MMRLAALFVVGRLKPRLMPYLMLLISQQLQAGNKFTFGDQTLRYKLLNPIAARYRYLLKMDYSTIGILTLQVGTTVTNSNVLNSLLGPHVPCIPEANN